MESFDSMTKTEFQELLLEQLFSKFYDLNLMKYKVVFKSRFFAKFSPFNVSLIKPQDHKRKVPKPILPHNRINLQNIKEKKDGRTTVMIKNIPNRFEFKQIRQLLEPNFHLMYDIICMPNDKNTKKNYGFAFINFVDVECVAKFFEQMNGKEWENTNSPKICEVLYSKIQGKCNLIHHYRKAHFYYSYETKTFP